MRKVLAPVLVVIASALIVLDWPVLVHAVHIAGL